MIKNKSNVKSLFFKGILAFSLIFALFASLAIVSSAATTTSTPVTGTRKTLTFVVYDKNDPNRPKTAAAEQKIINQVKDFMYGTACKDEDRSYGEDDSLRAWYYRSSYGKLDIVGDVYIHYIDMKTLTDRSYYGMLNDVYNKFKTKINWSSYFASNNSNVLEHTIKGVYFISGTEDAVRIASHYDGINYALADVESVRIGGQNAEDTIMYADCTTFTYPFCQRILANDREAIDVIAHETCHMFGFPDFHHGGSINENGGCSTTIMDCDTVDDINDIPSVWKYVMGWMDATVIDLCGQNQLYEPKTIKLQTSSYQNNLLGNQLLILKLKEDTTTTFYAVEFLTNEFNNNFNGIRTWLIKTKTGTLDEWVEKVRTYKNYAQVYVNEELEYMKALSADGETSYLMTIGGKLSDTTTPSLKIPVAYSYTKNENGQITATSIKSWINSHYQLTVDSYQNGNKCVMITVKPVCSNKMNYSYKSDEKSYGSSSVSFGSSITLKTPSALGISGTKREFAGWELIDPNGNVIETYNAGKVITPTDITKTYKQYNEMFGSEYIQNENIINSNITATFRAKWINLTTITIDPSGGMYANKTENTVITKKAGEVLVLSELTPPSVKLTFTGTADYDICQEIAAPCTVALWSIKNKTTGTTEMDFNEDFVHVITPAWERCDMLVSVTYNRPEITLPAASQYQRAGYKLTGWKDKETSIVYDCGTKYGFSENINFVPVWEKINPQVKLSVYKDNALWKSAVTDGFTATLVNSTTSQSYSMTASSGNFTANVPSGTYYVSAPALKGGSKISLSNYIGTITVSSANVTKKIYYYSVITSKDANVKSVSGGINWIIKGGTRKLTGTPVAGYNIKSISLTSPTGTKTVNNASSTTISGIKEPWIVEFSSTPKTIKVYYSANGGKCATTSHKSSDGKTTYYHAVGSDKLMRFSKTAAVTASSVAHYDTYTYKKGSFDPYNANGSMGLSRVGYAAPTKYTIDGTTGTAYAQDGANAAIAGALDKLIESGKTSVVLYAVWSPKTLTITLDKNTGTGGTDKLYEVYNSKFYTNTSTKASAATVTIPTRPGYTFNGYYSSESSNNGTGTQLIDANGKILAAKTKWSANATVYAKWTAKTITVKYHANGGTVDSASHKSGSTTYYHAIGSDSLLRYSNTAAVTSSSAVYAIKYTYGTATFNPVDQATFNLQKTGYKAAEKYTLNGSTGTQYATTPNAAIAKAFDKLIESGKTSVVLYSVWSPYKLSAYFWVGGNAAAPAKISNNYKLTGAYNGSIKNANDTWFTQVQSYNTSFYFKDASFFALKRVGYEFDGWYLLFTGSVNGGENKSISTGQVLKNTQLTPQRVSALITKYISDQKAKGVTIKPAYGTDISKGDVRVTLSAKWITCSHQYTSGTSSIEMVATKATCTQTTENLKCGKCGYVKNTFTKEPNHQFSSAYVTIDNVRYKECAVCHYKEKVQ